LYRRVGGTLGQSGRVRKIYPPPGFDPQTVQPVGSRCTGYDIPAHKTDRKSRKSKMEKRKRKLEAKEEEEVDVNVEMKRTK
jgi:hypothetical protein